MRLFAAIALVSCLAFALRAEEPAPQPASGAGVRATKPLPTPSNAKFNSTTGVKPNIVAAPAGQALTADGNGASVWKNINGKDVISNADISSGMVLTTDGLGKANWMFVSPTLFSGVLPIANGGTGSSTQNFVDLSSTQSIIGSKTFGGSITASGGITSSTISSGPISAGSITSGPITSSTITSGSITATGLISASGITVGNNFAVNRLLNITGANNLVVGKGAGEIGRAHV